MIESRNLCNLHTQLLLAFLFEIKPSSFPPHGFLWMIQPGVHSSRCSELLSMEHGGNMNIVGGEACPPCCRCLWCGYVWAHCFWLPWIHKSCGHSRVWLNRRHQRLLVCMSSSAPWLSSSLEFCRWCFDKGTAHSHQNTDTKAVFLGLIAHLACITFNVGFEAYHDNITHQDQVCSFPTI